MLLSLFPIYRWQCKKVNLPNITELLAQWDRNPGLTLRHGLEITVMVCFCMVPELRMAFKFLKVYKKKKNKTNIFTTQKLMWSHKADNIYYVAPYRNNLQTCDRSYHPEPLYHTLSIGKRLQWSAPYFNTITLIWHLMEFKILYFLYMTCLPKKGKFF